MTSTHDWAALVLIKAPIAAKTRLSPPYDAQQRREFAHGCVRHVVAVLQSARRVSRCYVLTNAVDHGVVPDARGTGSVEVALLSRETFVFSFGPGSSDRHQRAGATVLGVDLPRLRRDVATHHDLRVSLRLGICRSIRHPETSTG